MLLIQVQHFALEMRHLRFQAGQQHLLFSYLFHGFFPRLACLARCIVNDGLSLLARLMDDALTHTLGIEERCLQRFFIIAVLVHLFRKDVHFFLRIRFFRLQAFQFRRHLVQISVHFLGPVAAHDLVKGNVADIFSVHRDCSPC